MRETNSQLRKCPLCAQLIQKDAHHCHHCNSNIIDMDGNEVKSMAPNAPTNKEPTSANAEWLELGMKIMLNIFFTAIFFILGMMLLQILFGVMIIGMQSKITIFINIILLVISMVSSYFVAQILLNWVKLKLEQL